MKISRRSVLRYSGLTAALLALTGCSASPGSAILGGDLPDWMKSLVAARRHRSSASSMRPLHPLWSPEALGGRSW